MSRTWMTATQGVDHSHYDPEEALASLLWDFTAVILRPAADPSGSICGVMTKLEDFEFWRDMLHTENDS